MSAPVRFLALVVVGWGAVRAVTLGAVPGFTVSYAKQASPAAMSPIVTTQFPPLPPVEAALPRPLAPMPIAPVYLPLQRMPAPYAVPYAYDAALPIPPRPQWQLASSQAGPEFYSPIEPLEQWHVSTLGPFPARRSTPVAIPAAGEAAKPRLDRIQLSTWALLRGPSEPGSLSSGGTLGGSQGGARLTYAINAWLAGSLRTTAPLAGSRGAEAAAGIRLTPLRSIPVAITAERRQAYGHGGGRSAFALFAEAGLYRQPMPLQFNLDAYLQAGIVGANSRDLFVDGALAFTRPVYGRVSAGFGLWGGAQPGVYRLDGGPRVSIRVRDNIHAHAEWRQRLIGRARPSSGPALTLAADF